MLYGAIIGDMVGSVWEFHTIKKRPPKLFMQGAGFTDDTVMTIAVADALINDKSFAAAMRQWGHKYQYFGNLAGYGGNFARWLFDDKMPAYNSFGNGSAMRVSAVGYTEKTLEDTLKKAKMVSSVSHNHPEGIKGAQAVAGAIFLARKGSNKKQIKAFVEGLGYDLSKSCDEIRPDYYHTESCQGTIPATMAAFLESKDFADCMELEVSLGGDSDTMCAIAGGIAEAYYGIPAWMIAECRARLPKDMLRVVNEFEVRDMA